MDLLNISLHLEVPSHQTIAYYFIGMMEAKFKHPSAVEMVNDGVMEKSEAFVMLCNAHSMELSYEGVLGGLSLEQATPTAFTESLMPAIDYVSGRIGMYITEEPLQFSDRTELNRFTDDLYATIAVGLYGEHDEVEDITTISKTFLYDLLADVITTAELDYDISLD